MQAQLDAMGEMMRKMLLQSEQQAADAKARENALLAQLAAANAARSQPVVQQTQAIKPDSLFPPSRDMLFNPFQECQVKLSSAESNSCMWSGKRGGMDWRTARSTLIKTINSHSLRMASIAKGEYTMSDAETMGSAALQKWEIDNVQLAGIIFRTIKTDLKEGAALRSQIVQDAERNVINDNDGLANACGAVVVYESWDDENDAMH